MTTSRTFIKAPAQSASSAAWPAPQLGASVAMRRTARRPRTHRGSRCPTPPTRQRREAHQVATPLQQNAPRAQALGAPYQEGGPALHAGPPDTYLHQVKVGRERVPCGRAAGGDSGPRRREAQARAGTPQPPVSGGRSPAAARQWRSQLQSRRYPTSRSTSSAIMSSSFVGTTSTFTAESGVEMTRGSSERIALSSGSTFTPR